MSACPFLQLFVIYFFTKVLDNLAGVVGIEPTLTVLETGVLPLYDTPISKQRIRL